MKIVKGKELRRAAYFCMAVALLADVLCILYLLNVVQNHWFLTFIQILAVLLHLMTGMLGFVQKKSAMMWISLLLALGYAGSLLYYTFG